VSAPARAAPVGRPEERIRVAVVIPRYAPIFGGAENQCRQLTHALRASGAVSIPFTLTKRIRSDLLPVEDIDGVPVVRLGFPGISRWSEYGFYACVLRELVARRAEYDVIHCHATSLIGFIAALAGRLLRRPVVLKLSSNGELVTGFGREDGPPRLDPRLLARLRRPLARFAARNAQIVALNREGLDELQLAGARHPQLISNGVDTARFTPPDPVRRAALRKSLGIDPDEFVFLYTGRFVASKGIDTLLAAISRLRTAPAENDGLGRLRFAFVGSGELQDAAVGIDAHTDAVLMFPPTPDVLPYLHLADAFVFPSRREGTPNAVLEAMAVGLPCVLSDIRPHRELHERNPDLACYFFHPGDGDSLASAIARCVAMWGGGRPARAPGANPGGRLSDEFTLVHVARRYISLYRSLLGPAAESFAPTNQGGHSDPAAAP
jgi:glycosyltransferase involved in cell wall biosynthesis